MDTSIISRYVMGSHANLGGIYQIRQLSTNYKYIGSTRRFRDRYVDHFKRLRNDRHDNSHLQNAWNKYGADDFVFEIVEIVKSVDDKSSLLDKEQIYLNTAVNWDVDFNISKTAACPPKTKPGKPCSEATKEKIRAGNLGTKKGPLSAEARAKVAAYRTGRKWTDGQRKKMQDYWASRQEG